MPKLPSIKPANTSKTPSELHIDPQAESYVGHNHPYRGLDNHGVPDDNEPHGFDGYADMHSGEYEIEKEDVPPIPVRMVTLGPRELRRFNTTQTLCDSTTAAVPRMVAGRRQNRIQAFIYNNSANIVWIGNNESIQPFMGFPIPANSGLPAPMQTEDAIWVVCTAGQSATICVLDEFAVIER